MLAAKKLYFASAKLNSIKLVVRITEEENDASAAALNVQAFSCQMEINNKLVVDYVLKEIQPISSCCAVW